MFTEKFDEYACQGDTIKTSIDGLVIYARIEFDQDYHIDDDDVHNTDQSMTGCSTEQQRRLLSARQAWFNDEWWYCGIVLSATKNGVVLDEYAAALWGIECNYPGSNNRYLTEVANDLISDAVANAKTILKKLCT